jgi:hypothetical protein
MRFIKSSGKTFRKYLRRFAAHDHLRELHASINFAEEPRAAIKITGGIGDHIMAARFLRDLFGKVGPFAFDAYSSRADSAGWLLSGFPECKRIYSEYFLWEESYRSYPIALYLTQFACVMYESLDRRTIHKWKPGLLTVCESLRRYSESIRPHIEHHARLDGDLGRLASLTGFKRHTYLQGMAGIKFGGNLYKLPLNEHALDKFGLAERRYITVHNGYDAAFEGQGSTSTKIYPHFSGVIDRIKRDCPEIKIVQIGTTTSKPIDGVDLDLIDKTPLNDVVGLLKGAALHLDSESGLVHMASCVGTKSVVVFGPTSVEYYGYEENINIAPTVCGNCWWAKPTWNSQCVRGEVEPSCTYSQEPESVYRQVRSALWGGEEIKAIGKVDRLQLVHPAQTAPG